MSFVAILGVAGSIVLLLSGAGAVAGVVLLWGQQSALKSNLEAMALANADMRAENAALHEKIQQERVDCSRQIGVLHGQINALTGPLAEQIIQAAAAAAGKVAAAAAIAADGVLTTAATAAAAHPKETL